jgi:hypothetical protein
MWLKSENHPKQWLPKMNVRNLSYLLCLYIDAYRSSYETSDSTSMSNHFDRGTLRNIYNNSNNTYKYFCLHEQLKKRAIQAEYESLLLACA